MSLECACVYYNNGRCKKFTDDKYTSWCNAEGLCEDREPSNADRIREMSDEELSEIIICPKQVCDKVHILVGRTDCNACLLEWLKQPAEVTDNG